MTRREYRKLRREDNRMTVAAFFVALVLIALSVFITQKIAAHFEWGFFRKLLLFNVVYFFVGFLAHTYPINIAVIIIPSSVGMFLLSLLGVMLASGAAALAGITEGTPFFEAYQTPITVGCALFGLLCGLELYRKREAYIRFDCMLTVFDIFSKQWRKDKQREKHAAEYSRLFKAAEVVRKIPEQDPAIYQEEDDLLHFASYKEYSDYAQSVGFSSAKHGGMDGFTNEMSKETWEWYKTHYERKLAAEKERKMKEGGK